MDLTFVCTKRDLITRRGLTINIHRPESEIDNKDDDSEVGNGEVRIKGSPNFWLRRSYEGTRGMQTSQSSLGPNHEPSILRYKAFHFSTHPLSAAIHNTEVVSVSQQFGQLLNSFPRSNVRTHRLVSDLDTQITISSLLIAPF